MAQNVNTESSVIEVITCLATQYPKIESVEQLLRLKATLLHVCPNTYLASYN
jgi:hypothetical protein